MAKILLVDDEPMVLRSLKRMLETAKYEVHVAVNGREAIRVAHDVEPDLVVTDMLMPDMDGVELIQELAKSAQKFRVLAVSGGGRLSQGNYLEIAKALGAVATLSKPITRTELLDQVASILRPPSSSIRPAEEPA